MGVERLQARAGLRRLVRGLRLLVLVSELVVRLEAESVLRLEVEREVLEELEEQESPAQVRTRPIDLHLRASPLPKHNRLSRSSRSRRSRFSRLSRDSRSSLRWTQPSLLRLCRRRYSRRSRQRD